MFVWLALAHSLTIIHILEQDARNHGQESLESADRGRLDVKVVESEHCGLGQAVLDDEGGDQAGEGDGSIK